MMILSSLLTNGSSMQYGNNQYSNSHNVWTYTFSRKIFEEEYIIKEGDPSQLDMEQIKLWYFDYSNTNLPNIIVSQQLTTFLKSLTDNEYETAIKPILIHATTLVPEPCLYEESCDEKFIEYITTDDFIMAVKDILKEIMSTLSQSTYLDIFLQKQKYLWYHMYWSLDTTIDNPPIVIYDDFDQIYSMCFCGVNLTTVYSVQNIMQYMLKLGYSDIARDELNQIAKPWLDCINREYQHSVSIVKENHSSWTAQFLYNITTYTKATTMMQYMLKNIQNVDYDFLKPHKIKRILYYGKDEAFFEPIIYSLYIPTFLDPYISYVERILSDKYYLIKDPYLANLTLDTTVFGENVPLNETKDYLATNFIAYHNDPFTPLYDNKNDTNRLGKFVKFVAKAVMDGYVVVHYPIFGILYESYKLANTVYDLMFPDNEEVRMHFEEKTLDAIMADNMIRSMTASNQKLGSAHTELLWAATDCTEKPKIITTPFRGLELPKNDINHLRRIAPRGSQTEALLKNMQGTLRQQLPNIDFNLLGDQCKTFIGTLPIESDTVMANYLARLIKLYYLLRHLRPYDFYSHEKTIVNFIKFSYNLHNIRHFTYFQSYMLLYLQSIISMIANPNFRYQPINENELKANLQISTLKCELTFRKNDLTSLIMAARTMWGGRKLLGQYSGESGIIYQNYKSSIEKKMLNKQSLQNVYWHYREKKYINGIRHSTEELYAALENLYFRIYALLQDPVILAKIIDDLLIKMDSDN